MTGPMVPGAVEALNRRECDLAAQALRIANPEVLDEDAMDKLAERLEAGADPASSRRALQLADANEVELLVTAIDQQIVHLKEEEATDEAVAAYERLSDRLVWLREDAREAALREATEVAEWLENGPDGATTTPERAAQLRKALAVLADA